MEEEEGMPVRRKTYWRVSLGQLSQFFADEEDARDYAKHRAADPDNWDGIPFVTEIDERELLAHLNTLAASQ